MTASTMLPCSDPNGGHGKTYAFCTPAVVDGEVIFSLDYIIRDSGELTLAYFGLEELGNKPGDLVEYLLYVLKDQGIAKSADLSEGMRENVVIPPGEHTLVDPITDLSAIRFVFKQALSLQDFSNLLQEISENAGEMSKALLRSAEESGIPTDQLKWLLSDDPADFDNLLEDFGL